MPKKRTLVPCVVCRELVDPKVNSTVDGRAGHATKCRKVLADRARSKEAAHDSAIHLARTAVHRVELETQPADLLPSTKPGSPKGDRHTLPDSVPTKPSPLKGPELHAREQTPDSESEILPDSLPAVHNENRDSTLPASPKSQASEDVQPYLGAWSSDDDVADEEPALPQPLLGGEDEQPSDFDEPDQSLLKPIPADNSQFDAYGDLYSETEDVDVTDELSPDQVVAWMLHGLSNSRKQKQFVGWRVLEAMGNRRKPGGMSFMSLSSIHTTHAYDRYMDVQAEDQGCKYQKNTVSILSGNTDLQSIEPVPVYMRPLSEVLSCALAASELRPEAVKLAPFPPANTSDNNSPDERRVEHPMQGDFAREAKKVRFP